MNTLVCFALVACASAAPFIPDTPEVAAEKARFFQAFRAAQASSAPHQASFVAPPQTPSVWTGPLAATLPAGVVGAVDQVMDTADVQAARQLFFQTYNAQLAQVAPQQVAVVPEVKAPVLASVAPLFNSIPQVPSSAGVWTGPLAATVPAGVNGAVVPVADTADVQAARQAFFQAYNAQLAAAGAAPVPTPVVQAAVPVQATRWTGPFAATLPAGVPGAVMQVQETPEVQAARQQFFASHAQALATLG